MSLTVTATEIQIKNPSGTVKFTSANKLIYIKATKTNTITLGGAAVYDGFQALGTNDFLVMSFKINSCNKSLGQRLIGPSFVANGPTVLDYSSYQINSYTWSVDQEIMHWDIRNSNLLFYSERFYGGTFARVAPQATTNFTYTATIYSYL